MSSSASHNRDDDDDDDDDETEEEFEEQDEDKISDRIRNIDPKRYFRSRTKRNRRRPLMAAQSRSNHAVKKNKTKAKHISGGVKEVTYVKNGKEKIMRISSPIPYQFRLGDIVRDIRSVPKFMFGEVVKETNNKVKVIEIDDTYMVPKRNTKPYIVDKKNVVLEHGGKYQFRKRNVR